jgi:hypothetical protein
MRKNTPIAGVAEEASAKPKAADAPLALVPPGKKRLQLELSDEALGRLEKLRVRTQKQSQAEVVRNSLRVYEWLLDQLEKGYTLQLAKDDYVKEVEILL